MIFPEYYKCKKHNKNLKAFCHDCLNLVCENCMKEISHNTTYLEDEEYELDKDFVSTFNKKTKDYIDLLTKLGKQFPILKKND